MTASEPLYKHVQNDLVRKIASGDILEGEALPSEDALCKLYGVSRITVRKALDGLRAEQMIASRKGSGSYVTRPPRVFHGSLMDVISGAWDERRFISETFGAPPDIVREQLRLDAGEPVKIWEIVLVDRGRPLVHTRYYLRQAMGALVMREDIERTRSITRAIEEKANTRVARAVQMIEPCNASAAIARHLSIHPRAAVLKIVRTYFDQNDAPLHVAIVHAHPERYRYTIELRAHDAFG